MIIKKIKRLELDIIHSQTEWGVGTFARFAAINLGIPLVHTYHTLYEYYTHYITRGHFTVPAKKLAAAISRFYCEKCDALIVPTRKVEDILYSYDVDKVMNIIPTGLDLEKFYRKNYTEEVFDYFILLDEAYNMKIDNLYDFAKRVISDFDYKGHKLGIIYGIDGDYQSIIGDKILDDKKLDYEIVAFLNVYGTVSFRSKNNIDVSEIAKKLGMLVGYSGGGHKHASGCRICDKDEMKKKMMEIFEHSMNKIKIL